MTNAAGPCVTGTSDQREDDAQHGGVAEASPATSTWGLGVPRVDVASGSDRFQRAGQTRASLSQRHQREATRLEQRWDQRGLTRPLTKHGPGAGLSTRRPGRGDRCPSGARAGGGLGSGHVSCWFHPSFSEKLLLPSFSDFFLMI